MSVNLSTEKRNKEMAENEIDILLRLIEEKTGHGITLLRGSSRKPKIVRTRRIFFVICRKVLKMSFPQIGYALNKDHTTVIYNLRIHSEEIDVYEKYSKRYYDIYRLFNILHIRHTNNNNAGYFKNQIDILESKKRFIDKQIKEYYIRLKKAN